MKTKMKLNDAFWIGNEMICALENYTTRIEFVGSIRRCCELVGDIELVCIPRPQIDMFGQPTSDHMLNIYPWEDLGTVVKNGPKYKQIELNEGITLDLFIVTPPAQWGPIFLIRTGPEEYGHQMVTSRQMKTRDGLPGLMPSCFRFEDGTIYKGSQPMITPEEADVYKLFDMPYVEPRNRRPLTGK